MRSVLCVAVSCAGVLFGQSGSIQQYNTGNLPNGVGLSGITSGSDGALWFAGNQATSIGRIPTSGALPPTLLSASRWIFVSGRVDHHGPRW